jgi:IS605 OrfB family transposase
VSFPENVKVSIPLRNDRFKFEFSKESKDFNAWLRVLRSNFPLKLCKYHLNALKDASKICDSSIIKDKDGGLYLRLCFETTPQHHEGTKSLGVDIGMVKPIVCSDGHVIGSGGYIRHKKIEFGKKRARNQKLVQQILNKQSNWTADLNHKLSRELVDYCISTGVNVLVLERLKGGQLSNRKYRKYSWAFKDLLMKIEYKAQNQGIKVISVNPAYTSQTCSMCGLKAKANRKTQSLYECNSCGFRGNADINASKNILNLSVQNGLNMTPTSGKGLNHETQRSLVVG